MISNQPSETPRDAARRFAASFIRKGYKLEALHERTDPTGKVLCWVIRLKHPETGEKWIRPMRWNRSGYELKEPDFPDGKPLYRLHELTARPDEEIFIVEGEKCADKLAELGILATTSGSSSSHDKANWSPLAGRKVTLWPDNDEAGHHYMAEVGKILRALDCSVRIVDVAALDLPPKGDVVDWLEANPTATAVDIKALPTMEVEQGKEPNHAETVDNEDDGKKSQASALVAFVEANTELFHDQNKFVYAQDNLTRETRRIDGRQFRDWLVSIFYQNTGKAARDQSVREALATLAGLGRFHGECREVHVRVALKDGAYFLDLGEEGKNRAIRINAGSWEIVTDPPVRFIRPESLQPLPEPVSNGTLCPLWGIVNIPNDAKLLVLAWLCDCLRPDTPFPVLELIGEAGTAKSTTQKVFRRMIDPNACDLRSAPKSIEDVFVSAGTNWLVSFENISHLSAPMQDAFCILATGGGFAKRKLYTDADESIISVKRPIVLNGISVAVTAHDLIDRTVSVELPTIQENMDIPVLWRIFNTDHGKLLGALLDVMANALAHLPQITLPSKETPRLVEFARFGMAIAEALGKNGEEFMKQFNDSRQESIARTIDASPAAVALIEWFEDQGKQEACKPLKTLFEEVTKKKPPNTDAWPRTPKGFGDALRRAAPSLRQLGIECKSLGKIGGKVKWEVKERGNLLSQCPASPASPDVSTVEKQEQDFRTFRTSPLELSSADVSSNKIEVEL